MFGSAAVLADEEADLISLLQSDARATAKADACVRLRLVGSARAVPSIAALLGDPRLSQAARHALEGLPSAEATTALIDALSGATGTNKIGIIDSLGWRRDPAAVPLLGPLLADGDPLVGATAALALTRIGGERALAALEALKDKVAAPVRTAILNGLLAFAGRWLEEGRRAEADRIYRPLTDATEDESIRVAAWVGRIRASGAEGLPLILAGLEPGSDPVVRSAALHVAAVIQHPGATAALSALLGRVPPAEQAVLLSLLRRRGDPAAGAGVLSVGRSASSEVRIAAISALGDLGDDAAIPFLLESASGTEVLVQEAARAALVNLRRGEVTASLLAHGKSGNSGTRREVFRALGVRGDHAAVRPLMAMATEGPPEWIPGAMQALGNLVVAEDIGPLVELLTKTNGEEARMGIVGIFESLVERAGPGSAFDIEPILRGLSGSSKEVRVALLSVGRLFPDARLRPAYREALRDAEGTVREAAARALCDTRDLGFLPELLALARDATNSTRRALAVEGYVRLATDETATLSPAQRADALAALCAIPLDSEDRRRVLSGLSKVSSLRTFELAGTLGEDASVRSHAEFARVQIARGFSLADFEKVAPELRRLSTGAAERSVQTNALSLLQRWDSGWVGTGPFRVAGKNASDLFDVAFPPEQAGGKDLAWQRVPGSPDPERPGEVDLGELAGGDHAVVYVKTHVYVPAEETARFAIGSDDGIKLWLNGTLIHANNAVRGLTPGQDQAMGRLRAGWNEVLAKVTQHTAGCGLSMRITRPDGSAIGGLRLSSNASAN